MPVNFSSCAATFQDNPLLYLNYTYNGSIQGLLPGERPSAITLKGCYDLCGTGSEYYTWAQASGTILTWILPMIALLTKAPFESNQTRRTLFIMFRWFGSPISSLAAIFWNINVTGKCALMVDMATPYDEVPGKDTEFSDLRDSLYILTIMNQYTVRSGVPSIEGEKLLRIALFSDTLKLAAIEDPKETLPMKRKRLAYRLRAGRKRGLVPIFFSGFWWMFALAVSLENAFGHVGANATAHNLAIGLMMAWFPVLVFACVVDRTPFATPEIRIRLNNLLDDVRSALLDDNLRNTYMRLEGRTPDDFRWTEILKSQRFMGNSGFFTGFAGQGRGRWHHGIANPILTGIEEAYVAKKGRGWLGKTQAQLWESRTSLVVGPDRGEALEGLRYWDPREFWAYYSAFIVVGGTILGAFIISFYTPTVGLGCRSGGYTIFFLISFAIGTIEGLAWWMLPRNTILASDLLSDAGSASEKKGSLDPSNSTTPAAGGITGFFKQYETRAQIEKWILRPMEFVNMTWLIYIILAQTFGSYNNCFCQASTWGGHGGYIDFQDSAFYKAHGVTAYWAAGTGLSLFFMLGGIAYIIYEWCTQSHLSTENYDAAARGLRRTRTFKKYMRWMKFPVDVCVGAVRFLYESAKGAAKGRRGRRSLVWTWKMKSVNWTTAAAADGGEGCVPGAEHRAATGDSPVKKNISVEAQEMVDDDSLKAGHVYGEEEEGESGRRKSSADFPLSP